MSGHSSSLTSFCYEVNSRVLFHFYPAQLAFLYPSDASGLFYLFSDATQGVQVVAGTGSVDFTFYDEAHSEYTIHYSTLMMKIPVRIKIG